MNQTTPLISVVMPVHNARPFLNDSISSILGQTFADFEFVILDDCSTDGSDEAVRQWEQKDSRIRFFQSNKRLGLSNSSNLVVSKSVAPIVARMDADDISHPNRLGHQWEVLDRFPEVALVGTLCDGIDRNGRRVRPRDRWRIVRRSAYVPFPHGSAMFRRQAFEEIGGYNETTDGGEDQDLCLRMLTKGHVVTLPDVLYRYRYHLHNSTTSNGKRTIENNHFHNGNCLEAYYRLGSMRLWAGYPPDIFNSIVKANCLKFNAATVVTLVSALWGRVSPGTLRLSLRALINTRDFIASLKVQDGRPYQWRLK